MRSRVALTKVARRCASCQGPRATKRARVASAPYAQSASNNICHQPATDSARAGLTSIIPANRTTAAAHPRACASDNTLPPATHALMQTKAAAPPPGRRGGCAAPGRRARVPSKPHAEQISAAIVRLVAIIAAGAARANAGAAVARLMAIIRAKPARALIRGGPCAFGDTGGGSGRPHPALPQPLAAGRWALKRCAASDDRAPSVPGRDLTHLFSYSNDRARARSSWSNAEAMRSISVPRMPRLWARSAHCLVA